MHGNRFQNQLFYHCKSLLKFSITYDDDDDNNEFLHTDLFLYFQQRAELLDICISVPADHSTASVCTTSLDQT